MKRFPALALFADAILTFGMSYGAMLCVITAFDIPCSAVILALCCAVFALVFTLLFLLCRAWLALMLSAPILGVCLWYFWSDATGGLALAANTIAPVYLNAFSIGQNYILLPQLAQGSDATVFFCLLAMLVSILLCLTIVHTQSTSVCAVITLPFLILCLIILQTPPNAAAVLLLIGSLLLLMLTHQIREHDARQGASLTLLMLLPMALLFALMMLFSPPETYERSAWPDTLRARINETVDKLSFLRENEQTGQMEFVSPFTPSTLGSYSWDSSVKRVDLSKIGPQRKTGRSVMQIYAQNSGTIYLRASSMATYADNQWKALESESYDTDDFSADDFLSGYGSDAPLLEIRTNMKSSVLYVPYYATALPASTEIYGDAYVKNTLQATDYSIFYNPSGSYGAGQEAFAHEHYLDMPDETRAAVSSYIAQNPAAASASYAAAFSLVQTLRESKQYSLDTPKAPSDEDFVSWFLLESDTGYCVHFATAATMILRYFGIPARYVTGYMATAAAGEWSQVTEDTAHAWAEYYVSGLGWQAMEATPSDTGADATGDEPDVPDTDTQEQQPDSSQQNPGAGENTPDQMPSSGESKQNNQSPPDTSASKPVLPSEEGRKATNSRIWSIIWCVLVLAALWFVYRIFILSARKMQLSSGNPNRRAVMLYRHILRLAKLAGEPVEESLTELAQRAKFSQHKLELDEIAPMIAESQRLTQILRQTKSPLKRFTYRMIYVIW